MTLTTPELMERRCVVGFLGQLGDVGRFMTTHAEVSTREQAKLYLEWAECARRDASRAVGRGAQESYLATAEQWDALAVDIKRKLWREDGFLSLQSPAPAVSPPKFALDRVPLDETERFKREAKRPRNAESRGTDPVAPKDRARRAALLKTRS